MDWAEKQQCVLCDEGGKLLICSGDGCPISVHKSCMGCKAHFDDMGNFHCPYCLYKQLAAEACQLKAKVILAKKALSTFLEEETRDTNHQEPTVGNNQEEEIKILSKDKAVDGNDFVSDNVQNRCEETHDTFVSEQTIGSFNRTGEIQGLGDVNTCRVMVVYEPNSKPVDRCVLDGNPYDDEKMKADHLESDVTKRIKVDKRTGNDKCRSEVIHLQQHVTSIEEEAHSKNAVKSSPIENQYSRKKRNHLMAFTKNGNRSKQERMIGVAAEILLSIQTGTQSQSKSDTKIDHDESEKRHTRDEPFGSLDNPNGATTKGSLEAMTSVMGCTKISNIRNQGEVKNSSKQLSVTDRIIQLPLQNGKGRVLWSEGEEDMLKEGVQKYTLLSRKNIPWTKILEFGRHVFDSSRTPADLKDKWRKIAK